jgi:transposase
MFYLGIDVGRYHHAAALADPRGATVALLPQFPATAEGFLTLRSFVQRHLPPGEQLRVGIEATGPYWQPLARWLSLQGWPCVVDNPIKASSLRNYGIRGAKTDRIDAVLIAQALRWEDQTPRAQPHPRALQLRQLTRLHTHLVKDRTRAALRIDSLLASLFPELPPLLPKKRSSPTTLALLEAAPSSAKALALGLRALTTLLRRTSRGKLGQSRARRILDAARRSVGVPSPAAEIALTLLVAQVRLLNEQLDTLEKHIFDLYSRLDLPLHSLPGVGLLLAAILAAELGSVHLFARPQQMVAFAGIDPKLRQSGSLQGQVRMSKRGSRHLRRAIYLACQNAVRSDDQFKALYQRHLARSKPARRALGAVMNHFVHVLFAIWRDNRPYVPLTSS